MARRAVLLSLITEVSRLSASSWSWSGVRMVTILCNFCFLWDLWLCSTTIFLTWSTSSYGSAYNPNILRACAFLRAIFCLVKSLPRFIDAFKSSRFRDWMSSCYSVGNVCLSWTWMLIILFSGILARMLFPLSTFFDLEAVWDVARAPRLAGILLMKWPWLPLTELLSLSSFLCLAVWLMVNFSWFCFL